MKTLPIGAGAFSFDIVSNSIASPSECSLASSAAGGGGGASLCWASSSASCSIVIGRRRRPTGIVIAMKTAVQISTQRSPMYLIATRRAFGITWEGTNPNLSYNYCQRSDNIRTNQIIMVRVTSLISDNERHEVKKFECYLKETLPLSFITNVLLMLDHRREAMTIQVGRD